MTQGPEPLLVYNRVDANRRRTRLLLVVFAGAMLPFASGVTVWVAMPLVFVGGLFVVGLAPGLAETIAPTSVAQAVMIEAGLLGSALVFATIALVAATMWFINRYSSAMILRAAQARSVARDDELGLHQIVENLCIGAGLPKPRLYLIESSTPNAFATGRVSGQAALVLTRGLLTLLDRRELEGVIAHELSHIGNQDIRLDTTLAGLVGTLTLPLTMIMAVLRSHPIVAALGLVVALPLVSGFLLLGWQGLTELPGQATGRELPPLLWWLGLHSFATPFYIVLVAPVVARLLRRGVSREREFLADADAVTLTRNPSALAVALIKVGSAHGTRIRVGPASAHMYFVDPVPVDRPGLAGWFRSHPPLEDRLELLLRMGSGIPLSAVHDAIRAGTASRPVTEPARSAVPARSARWVGSVTREVPYPTLVLIGAIVLLQLWRGPSPLADIVLLISAGTAVWYHLRRRGPSIQDANAAPPKPPRPSEATGASVTRAGDADLGQRFQLVEPMTMLYSSPDGWSRPVDQLPAGTAVTLEARDDNGFVQARTEKGSIGYIGCRTRLIPEH